MTKRSTSPVFTPTEVRRIRAEHDAGTLDAKAWAASKVCSAETVRKVGRRETYNSVPDGEQLETAGDLELSAEEVEASFKRLQQAVEAAPLQRGDVNHLLDELQGKGKDVPKA